MKVVTATLIAVVGAAAWSSPPPLAPPLVWEGTTPQPCAKPTSGPLPKEADGGRGATEESHPQGRKTGEDGVMILSAILVASVSRCVAVVMGAGAMPMLMSAVAETVTLTMMTDPGAGMGTAGATTETVATGMFMWLTLLVTATVVFAVLAKVMTLTSGTLTRTKTGRLTFTAGERATMMSRRPPAEVAEPSGVMVVAASLMKVMNAVMLRCLDLMVMAIAARTIASTSISPAPPAPTSRNGKGTPQGGRSDER